MSEGGYITRKTYMYFLLLENSRASLRFTTCKGKSFNKMPQAKGVRNFCKPEFQSNYLPAFICGIQRKVAYCDRCHRWCPTTRDNNRER